VRSQRFDGAHRVTAAQRHLATGWSMVDLVDFSEVPYEKQRWGRMGKGIRSTI
jgi:hypothetical protein